MITLRKHRFAFILLGLIAAVGVIAPLFLIAGCRTLQQTPQEVKARATLRAMTRGGVLPAEDAVARIESDYPRTTAGALAKIVHARIKLNAKDFADAASLLDSSTIRDYTVIGDYGLWLRASALEQANRRPQARAAYEQLARSYPSSIRARDAMLHDAQILMQDGQAAAVPVALQQLAAKDDAAALLLTAKAYEQTGKSTIALTIYRRIYFYAPASTEAEEAGRAANSILKQDRDRLAPPLASTPTTGESSVVTPANPDEAIARAERLFAAKHYGDAVVAYGSAFFNIPSTAADVALLAHRAIAAANVRRFPEAIAALNASPAPTGEP